MLESLAARLALAANGGSDGSFWMPPQASTTAAEVDRIFYWVFYISLFFFTLIVVLMVIFAFRFRRQSAQPVAGAPAVTH